MEIVWNNYFSINCILTRLSTNNTLNTCKLHIKSNVRLQNIRHIIFKFKLLAARFPLAVFKFRKENYFGNTLIILCMYCLMSLYDIIVIHNIIMCERLINKFVPRRVGIVGNATLQAASAPANKPHAHSHRYTTS